MIRVVLRSAVITGKATATAEVPAEKVVKPRQQRKKTTNLRMVWIVYYSGFDGAKATKQLRKL